MLTLANGFVATARIRATAHCYTRTSNTDAGN